MTCGRERERKGGGEEGKWEGGGEGAGKGDEGCGQPRAGTGRYGRYGQIGVGTAGYGRVRAGRGGYGQVAAGRGDLRAAVKEESVAGAVRFERVHVDVTAGLKRRESRVIDHLDSGGDVKRPPAFDADRLLPLHEEGLCAGGGRAG